MYLTEKAIIFDLDGTILDSMDAWLNVDKKFLAENEIEYPDGLEEKMKTLGYKDACQVFVDNFKINMTGQQVMDRIRELIEGEYRDIIEIKPFVREYLKLQNEKGIKMCVLTACQHSLAKAALERAGIFEYFDFVVSSDEMEFSKDNPLIFIKCAERLNEAISDIIVFEDALHCIKSAKSAGFKVIGVYDKANEKDMDKISEYSDMYIKSFEELL